MRLTSSALALCLVLSAPLFAAEDRAVSGPSRSYLSELHLRLMNLAEKESAVMNLLNQSVTKSGSATVQDFLSLIHFCRDDTTRVAAVSQASQQLMVFLARTLEEPENASDDVLIDYYQAHFKEVLPPVATPKGLRWKFASDTVLVSSHESGRLICIKPGIPADLGSEALVHELVHYVRTDDSGDQVDMLGYRDLEDYATQTILKPGEEVDAYALQFSLTIRHHGKRSLPGIGSVASLFSDRGELIGNRTQLVRFVLDDLGYLKSRFVEEYAAQVRNQLRYEEQRLQILTTLLGNRDLQATELRKAQETRWRLLNFIFPGYKAESLRVQRLLARAQASQERLLGDVASAKARVESLRARLEPGQG